MAKALQPFLTNRNPRNLELLRYAWKPVGYQLEKDCKLRTFYYKVLFEPSSRYTCAQLLHYKDGLVLSASTKEIAIRNRLHGGADVSACENIGRILAHRCLKAGVYFASKEIADEDLKNASEKVRAFYHGLQDGGLVLQEPPSIEPDWSLDKRYHTRIPEQENSRESDRQLNYSTVKSAQKTDPNDKSKFLPLFDDL